MFEDNQDVLDLINGVFQLLDDQTKVKIGSDSSFLTNVNQKYDKPTGPKGRFRKVTRIGKVATSNCFGACLVVQLLCLRASVCSECMRVSRWCAFVLNACMFLAVAGARQLWTTTPVL